MELSNRKTKIIVELLKQEDYITGRYLTGIFGVTTRTIRSEVASLNKELLPLKVQIESSPGKGYFISSKNKVLLSSMVDKSIKHKIPIFPESRINYIIKELLYHPKGILQIDISNQLYVSESTLKRDFEKVNQYLLKYKLRLAKNIDKTYFVAGEEADVRKLYYKYFSKAGVTHIPNSLAVKLYDATEAIILKIIDEIDLELSGNEFRSIVLFITILQFRFKSGFNIEKNIDNSIQNADVLILFEKLCEYIELPNVEKKYLYTFLIDIFCENKNAKHVKMIVQDILEDVNKTFEYQLSIKGMNNLNSLLLRNKHVELREYSESEFNHEYPFAFEIAMYFIQQLKNTSIEVSKVLRTHIILEFICDVELNLLDKESKTQNVVVISQSGDLSKEYLSTKLKKHFPNFNVIGYFPLHMIEIALKLDPYLVISTAMITIEKIPLIVIDPLFKDYDIMKVHAVVRKLQLNEEVNFDFSNLFKEDLFMTEIEANSPYEVIKLLWDKMTKKGLANEQLLEAVYDRENISSTALGNLVALPHAIGDNAQENVVSVGILRKPMKWNTDKVQIVFLMNLQNTTDGRVKKIFDSFFEIINSSSKVNSLIKSENFYEFIKNITL